MSNNRIVPNRINGIFDSFGCTKQKTRLANGRNKLARPQPQCTLNPCTTSQMVAIKDKNDIVPVIRKIRMRCMSIEVFPKVVMRDVA